MQAPRRRWKKVVVEIRGTMLMIQPIDSSRNFRGIRKSFFGDRQSSDKTRIYTLQAAQAGIATDYHKKHFSVMRVRAEAEQFLFAATSPTISLEWVEKLNAAAAISLALDDREEPKYGTLPRAGSNELALDISRASSGLSANETPDEGQISVLLLMRDGQAYMHPDERSISDGLQSHSQLSDNPWHSAQHVPCIATTRQSSAQSASRAAPSCSPPPGNCPNNAARARKSSLSLITAEQSGRTPVDTLLGISHTSIEKLWSPPHHVMTVEAEIKWAWRCATVLEYSSKRTHKYVVYDGRKWNITRQGQLRLSSTSVACLSPCHDAVSSAQKAPIHKSGSSVFSTLLQWSSGKTQSPVK